MNSIKIQKQSNRHTKKNAMELARHTNKSKGKLHQHSEEQHTLKLYKMHTNEYKCINLDNIIKHEPITNNQEINFPVLKSESSTKNKGN